MTVLHARPGSAAPPTPPPLDWRSLNATTWQAVAGSQTYLIRRNATIGRYRLQRNGDRIGDYDKLAEAKAAALTEVGAQVVLPLEPEPAPAPRIDPLARDVVVAPAPDPAALFPAGHRTGDHATSVAAAHEDPGSRSSQRVRMGQCFRNAGDTGLTDEEAAVQAGISMRACFWKRCSELRAMGYLTPTGETRVSVTTGSGQQVWRMDAAARAAWDAFLQSSPPIALRDGVGA